MEEMHTPFKGVREKNREKILEKGNGIGFTGLVYDVGHKGFHVACKDPATGRIRIECTCDEADQEASTSVSAA